METQKMKVEIWSDVVCPFCYIGKRHFESALSQFKDAARVEVVWKSFQLLPGQLTTPGISLSRLLAEHKGISLEQAESMNGQVTHLAKQTGLVYNLDKAVPANSLNAHRFSHFAKHHDLQDKAEEALFKAYFTDGKNIDDIPTLVQLGTEIGLDTAETQSVLESDQYTSDVRGDIHEAQQVGVRGVPFFVFDRKAAVSGAQDTRVFLEHLEKTYSEWHKQNPETGLEVTEGDSCEPGKDCN